MSFTVLIFVILQIDVNCAGNGATFLNRGTFERTGARAQPRMRNELLSRTTLEKMGVKWRGNSSRSHEMLANVELPMEFSWCNSSGVNYCTSSRNQHIPQYCGSCWVFAALSALEDRIKIARQGNGPDIRLAPQHVLNCANGFGTCHGGGTDSTYQWLYIISHSGTGISYESSQSYLACSSDSEEGFCPHVDTTCKPENIARTCGSLKAEEGQCRSIGYYPNATISDYGSISGSDAMQKEIFQRGTIMCAIAGIPLLQYERGIAKVVASPDEVNHVIAVTGWGVDAVEGKYWHIRNSWGEYWGEMGYARVKFGSLAIEEMCSWAIPGTFTAFEHQNQPAHCHEAGENC